MCRLPCPSAGRRTTLCVNNNVRKRSGSSRPWPQEMTDARQRPPSRFRSRRALPLSSTNPAAPAWSPAPDHRCAGERLLRSGRLPPGRRTWNSSGGGGRAAPWRGGLRAHPTTGLGVWARCDRGPRPAGGRGGTQATAEFGGAGVLVDVRRPNPRKLGGAARWDAPQPPRTAPPDRDPQDRAARWAVEAARIHPGIGGARSGNSGRRLPAP
jgi:hypothetical protein